MLGDYSSQLLAVNWSDADLTAEVSDGTGFASGGFDGGFSGTSRAMSRFADPG
jgi:hypothetical protein